MNYFGRVFMWVFLLFGFSRAALAGPSFQEANSSYREGSYSAAAEAYESIAKTNPSPEIYYNLGNAYFKDKKMGLAILNYERARMLTPRDRDILTNLAFMNRLLEYKIEDKRSWYLKRTDVLLEYVTSRECWAVALGAYFVFIAGLLFAILFGKKPLFGTGGALAFLLVLLCCLPVFLKLTAFGSHHKAIVTGAKAEVRYGPSDTDRLAFRLVEGLKASIRDERQDWYRIELADGRNGWVPKTQMTSI